MVSSDINDSGDLCTSTPFQCRHDSGYGLYSGSQLPLELSPIRKCSKSPVGLVDDSLKKFFEIQGHCVDFPVVAKKLSFSYDSKLNVSYRFDSGYISVETDGSSVSTQNKSNRKSERLTDENFNLILSKQDSTPQNKLHQPYKFICRDHSHEKGKCIKNEKFSQKFDGYRILPPPKKNYYGVDVLSELDRRNCYGIISDILSYLPDPDLVRTSSVSKKWQQIVNGDKDASKRRNTFINNRRNISRGPTKENGFKAESPPGRGHSTAFTHVGNVIAKQPLVSDSDPILARFDAFLEEAKLVHEALMKCPKCLYPARADFGDKFCCTRKMCKYEFCKKCQGPHLDNHVCTVLEFAMSLSNIAICSKKSKKNLRRLRA